MIISSISGGLGNQMFQYAAGYALARSKGVRLKLDISAYDRCQMHEGFLLNDVFNMKAEIAAPADVVAEFGIRGIPWVRRGLARINAGLLGGSYVREPKPFHFWPGLFDAASSSSYLHGNWQSELYLKQYESEIRSEFSFRTQAVHDSARKVEEEILSENNSVSIHVRRGDFADDPALRATYGICSIEYYRDAIKYLESRVGGVKSYVFSDDMAWVKKNFNIGNAVHVDVGRDIGSWVDMYFMSLCRHNITANSTFSWWAAWLNANLDKIVITPREWDIVGTKMPDLIPIDWIKI